MHNSKEQMVSLDLLAHQLCKEGLCHRPTLLLATWEAAKKVIVTHSQHNKTTILANTFVAWTNNHGSKYSFSLEPTDATMRECGIKSRNTFSGDLQEMGVIKQQALYNNLPANEKEYFKSDKQLLLRFFYLFVGKMKDVLKQNRNIEINMERFGVIKLFEKVFMFDGWQFNDKVFSPSCKYKRVQVKENNSRDTSSKMTTKFFDSINEHKSPSQIKKRPYFHQLIVENEPANTRIHNDLLGAGLDPLTCNISHSKLIDNTHELLAKEFNRPEPSDKRYPCVIDKFSRTKGTQLTGVKVGNTIVVRIGSNYSPSARNYYLDITTKCIELKTSQVRIKLDSNKQRGILPASEDEEYQFVMGSSKKQLESRVQLRKQIYRRYCQYYKHLIPNDCVAGIKKESVQKIIKQVKSLVRSLGRQNGSPLINRLMAEANKDYYLSYKKAVLDYILKDKDQMTRTSINITFKVVPEWGKPTKKHISNNGFLINTKESKKQLEHSHILYPDCLNKIYLENQKVNQTSLFRRRKDGQYRPFSLLYYIKRNINQLNEGYNSLCEGWVKTVGNIIQSQIDLKQESYQRLKQFFNSIHIIMSNKLKEIIYSSISDIFNELSAYGDEHEKTRSLLLINVTENGQNISFIDDIDKVFRFQLLDIIDKIVETTRRVPRVETYLKLSNDMNIWGIDENDFFIGNIKKTLYEIIQQNYSKIKEVKQNLKKLQSMFGMIEKVAIWCKEQVKVEELKYIFQQIQSYQSKIEEVKCYYMADMVVIDCIELKRKLTLHLKQLKKIIFETVDESMKQKNTDILNKISAHVKILNKNVKSTKDYVELNQNIEDIKQNDLPLLKILIEKSFKDTMHMFSIDGFTANSEVMRSTYMCRNSYEQLNFEIAKNQKRLYEERLDLEKKLRDKINRFQSETLTCFRDISSKLDSFDMRKLYNEYLGIFSEYKQKVEDNKSTQKKLNVQEEDLKWTPTIFPHARDLQNLVEPNYQLWQLIAEYDQCIKEWKYIELSNFDIDSAEARMKVIDGKVTKLISRLKSFAGLKIVYELQNDVKEFLGQQVSIIRIFSNPGLKDRHWSLFNKRLPLSGYDLKELTYGRIKLLYEYEKNLKVLMSISNQAAKQFEIENEKQEMYDYWNKLHFVLRNLPDENIVFIDEEFLDSHLALIEQHLTKTVILKNSPFSKALVVLLSDWQNWLLNGRKMLGGFLAAQKKFIEVRAIFRMDQINKLLPIESTQYDSIENIWKSVVKKILDHPRVSQFLKSPKMPDIIEEVGRKADFVKSSFSSYLALKRSEFTRLYFLPESTVLQLISLQANNDTTTALQLIGWSCFTGVRQCLRDDSFALVLKSSCDQLVVKCEMMHSKKGKSKFFEELVVLEKNMRENIKMEIKLIEAEGGFSCADFDKNTLTTLLTAIELEFSNKLESNESLGAMMSHFKVQRDKWIKRIDEEHTLKYELILSKILFILERCQNMSQKQSISLEQIVLFQETFQDIQLKFFHQAIKYNYEYLGDETPIFLPDWSDRLLWQIAYSLNQHVGVISSCQETTRQLAHFAGQYFVNVNNPMHCLDINFNACVMGVITTNYWISFNDSFLKMTCNMISKLTHAYQLKKEKIEQGANIINLNNQELTINSATMVFLNMSQERAEQLPQGILTCTRSISYVPPSVAQFKQYLQNYEKLVSLKQYIHILHSECSSFNVNLLIQSLSTEWDEAVQQVKTAVWKHLDATQQATFMSLFCENVELRDEFECKDAASYMAIKREQIEEGLRWSDTVLVVGEQSCKSTLIETVLKARQVQLYSQNRGVNLDFIEEGVSEMNMFEYLEKARQKNIKNGSDIYLFIDSDISQQELQCIHKFQHLHRLSAERCLAQKIIIEGRSLDNIDPQTLTSASIVYIRSELSQSKTMYKEWVDKLQICLEDLFAVKELEASFDKLINYVLRLEKRPFNEGKPMLARRFLNFFEVFLNNLQSKQVERMCDLEKENYIFNSFVYSAYWALGVSSLRSIQIEGLKKIINDMFGEKLDLPGQLEDIYLSEDNEWVHWDSLRQDFTNDKEHIPFYQIWVPTANNTKMLTVMVKLIERNNSVLLCGTQSGRSSLLNQISCFELTFNTFFVDCHKNTSTSHLASLTKGKVLFGQSKTNLILIDDLHLPKTQACGISRTFIERGYCANTTTAGKLNEFINKPTIIATWKNQSYEDKRCFWRFFGKTIPIQTEGFESSEIEFIFKTYLNCLWPNEESNLNFLKLQSTLLNYCTHTIKSFQSVQAKHLRMIIESLCRYNIQKGERDLFQHILVETQSILEHVIPSHQRNHFFRHMCHYYSRFMSIQLKNQQQLKDITDNHIYDIRRHEEGEKKMNLEEMTLWMQEVIGSKNSTYHLPQFHAKIIQKVVWSLKNNNSHIILLSSFHNGSRSIAKMAGILMGIETEDCKNISVGSLLEQVVKVLKTGGKADECIKVMGQEVVEFQEDLLKLVHSLLFSPEFHECFGQILMEQIIKSFNSEKKFLKKNVKKAQLIKKIREKVNMIYHFCLCVSRQSYSKLVDQYPRFTTLRVIEVDAWPTEALHSVSKKFITERSEEVFRAMMKIDQQVKNKFEALSKCSITAPLNIFTIYSKVMKMLEAKSNSHQNTEIWTKRVKLNKERIDSLEVEKKIYESQHIEYNENMKKVAEQIKQAQEEIQRIKENRKQIEAQRDRIKDQSSLMKVSFEKHDHDIREQYTIYVQEKRNDFMQQTQAYLHKDSFKKLTSAYSFQVEKANSQIIEFLYQLEADYFNKLSYIDCSDLGGIHQLIEKFKSKMEEQFIRQGQLSEKFNLLEQKQGCLRLLASHSEALFIKVRDLKDDETFLKEHKQPAAKIYEEIVKKIQLHENIQNILLKYEYILKSKTDCPLTPTDLTGSSLLITYLLAYYPFLEEAQLDNFASMIISSINETKIHVSLEDMRSFFSQEEQFELTHKCLAGNDEWINLLAIKHAGDLGVVTLGQPQTVSQWVERSFPGKNSVWLKEGIELRDMLQQDQVIFINNPSRQVIQNMSYLLFQSANHVNSGKTLKCDDEELNVHNGCKVIFIFNNAYQVYPEVRLSGFLTLKIFEHKTTKLQIKLEDYLQNKKQIGCREELVLKILKGFEQMGGIDEKMHSIIARMRKQNAVSEIVVRRIEEEGQNKLNAIKNIQSFKNQIASINQTIQKYAQFLKESLQVSEKFKHKTSFKSFSAIYEAFLEINSIEDISSVPVKIKSFMNIITNSDKKPDFEEIHQVYRLIPQLTLKHKTVLTVSDLSIASTWIEEIFATNLESLRRVKTDSFTINDIGEKQINLILVSQQQEFNLVSSILESSQEKLRETTVIILALEYLSLPLYLNIKSSPLKIDNNRVLLSKKTMKKDSYFAMPPAQIMNKSQKLYQYLLDLQQAEAYSKEDYEEISSWLK